MVKEKKIEISRELANAMIALVHERWMYAAVDGARDAPYWRELQLECEGIRNALIETALGMKGDE